MIRSLFLAATETAFDPNVLAAVMGSIVVAAVTTLPMYRAGKRSGNSNAIVGNTDAINELKTVVLSDGVYTRVTLQRIEKKLDEHIKDPNAHQKV